MKKCYNNTLFRKSGIRVRKELQMVQYEVAPPELIPAAQQVAETHPVLDVYGADFLTSAARLLDTHPTVADAYLVAYERLAMQAGNTAWMFPEREREAARQSTIALFGSSIDTIQRHYDDGAVTNTDLSLIGRPPEKVDLFGTEPLVLLESLAQAYWVAGQVMNDNPDSTIRTTCADKGDGYKIYRFIDTAPDAQLPPCATLYVRGEGSDTYNPKREYGGRNGVAASISLCIDVKLLREHLSGYSTKMSSLGNSTKANDGVISLRLDRSGVEVEFDDGSIKRLPTTLEGKAEHDIGSVLSEDVGRLIGANNSTLNHLLLSPELGRADVFSSHANDVNGTVSARQISHKALMPMLRKQQQTRQASGPFPLFTIGQNPYDLPGVRELAAYSGIELGDEPSADEIQRLFKLWGSQKAFQYNAGKLRESTPHLEYAHLARLVGETGIMAMMPARTIYGPVEKVRKLEVGTGVVLEGTAPWISRRNNHLLHMAQQGARIGRVVLGATERTLDTPTEVNHPDVVALHRRLQRVPTAVDFMEVPVRARLHKAGIKEVEVVGLPHKYELSDGSTHTTSGREVAQAIMERYPYIAHDTVFNALNAPAGAMFYGTLDAFMEAAPHFDPSQFMYGHGSNRLARTYLDNVTTGLFQNVYTAPSSLVRWIDAVHKINQRFFELAG